MCDFGVNDVAMNFYYLKVIHRIRHINFVGVDFIDRKGQGVSISSSKGENW